MEDLIAFALWLVVELLLVQTGRGVIWCVSFGRWRGEKLKAEEGRIYSAAGSLSFKRDGQRVVTANGMFLVGIVFYIGLVAVVLFLTI